MPNQVSSGPTQTAVVGASNEWAPRPFLAGATRIVIFVFPYLVGFALAIAAGIWYPASRVGLHPIVWFLIVAVLSTLAMIPADRLVRRLVPLTGLLTVALAFPDAAPSRFKSAMRASTTAQVKRRIEEALAADEVSADLDRNQYLLDLVSILTSHDRLTRGHSERVRAYSTLMGEELHLSKSDQQKLYWAALLHDIGKLDVPEAILNKPGRPDKEEWEILQSHPDAAERYLAPLQGWLGDWSKAATEHHLRWDGKGYPKDLGGTDVSLAGRLVAIADAYDVMTSARSYKDPMSAADARIELSRCAGGQFDPQLVRAFLNIGLRHVRLAGGALTSLPALVNTVIGTLATNGGRVLMATTAVATGVAAVPIVDFEPPPAAEVVLEAEEVAAPTPSPTPSPTPTVVPAVLASVPDVVTATPEPTAEPTATPTPTSAPLFEFDLEVAPSEPQLPQPRATPTAAVPSTPTPVPTTPTPVPTRFELIERGSVVQQPTATSAPTSTVIPTSTAVPTSIATAAPTSTALPTATPLPTATAIPTSTPVPTATATPVPTSTPVPTATAIPTSTPVPTATATPVPTATPTPTAIPTSTPVPTATAVPTATPTATATATAVPTATPTVPSTCPQLAGCPDAADDVYLFAPGQERRLRVLLNDSTQGAGAFDLSTLTIVDQPENAADDRFFINNNRVHYRPLAGHVGSDSFTYEICNTDGLCDTATVAITVSDSLPLPDVCSDVTEPEVMFSYDIDRRNGEPLDGTGFIGLDTWIFIFARVTDTTDRVRFYVDDQLQEQPPLKVEFVCPYDLLGTEPGSGYPSRGVALGDLGNGIHTITIEVFDLDGTSEITTATFGVLVGGDPGEHPDRPSVSDCADAQAGELDLQNAKLAFCPLEGLDMTGANLAFADLEFANLTGTKLTDADLTNAGLFKATLVNANLTDANLSGANLTEARAMNSNFERVDLSDAIMIGADFSDARLKDADLPRADLRGSDLSDANAYRATFDDAVLQNATLTGANFRKAQLQRADLSETKIANANFDETDLTNVTLLDAIGTPNDTDDSIFNGTICPDGTLATGSGCWP